MTTMQALEEAQVFVEAAASRKRRFAAAAEGSTTRVPKRFQHVPLMEDAGLSEGDRRAIRHEQRVLYGRIQQGPAAAEPSLDFYDDRRVDNNHIWVHGVRYARESVLDADNQGLCVERTKLVTDKLRQVRVMCFVLLLCFFELLRLWTRNEDIDNPH